MYGIDISYWQKSNWQAQIDRYGKDFVICRAAFDKNVDSMCDPMYQYAKKQGKKLGVYFFPLSQKSSAENHAEWSYNQVKGYIGEAIIALDWEAYSSSHNVADTGWALRWLKKFEELSGVKPVIYMNSSCERSYDWSAVVANNNGLWIANYGNNTGNDNGRPSTKYWKVAAIHQFTSRYDGNSLDGDHFYGDRSTWDLYAKKLSTTTVEKPVEKPATTDKEPVEKPVENSTNDKDIEKCEKVLTKETPAKTSIWTVIINLIKSLFTRK